VTLPLRQGLLHAGSTAASWDCRRDCPEGCDPGAGHDHGGNFGAKAQVASGESARTSAGRSNGTPLCLCWDPMPGSRAALGTKALAGRPGRGHCSRPAPRLPSLIRLLVSGATPAQVGRAYHLGYECLPQLALFPDGRIRGICTDSSRHLLWSPDRIYASALQNG
jgi:hypothetical protein